MFSQTPTATTYWKIKTSFMTPNEIQLKATNKSSPTQTTRELVEMEIKSKTQIAIALPETNKSSPTKTTTMSGNITIRSITPTVMQINCNRQVLTSSNNNRIDKNGNQVYDSDRN